MPREREPPASFLGTGWGFPPSFSAGGAELVTVSGVDDIHEALGILLATRPGERPMHETFGCDLDAALFEEADHALVHRVTAAISDAILTNEPRVVLHELGVHHTADTGVLQVRLEYGVPGTNSRYNMVFPFYLNEAVTPRG